MDLPDKRILTYVNPSIHPSIYTDTYICVFAYLDTDTHTHTTYLHVYIRRPIVTDVNDTRSETLYEGSVSSSKSVMLLETLSLWLPVGISDQE